MNIQTTIVFEVENDAVFDTALATMQHSLVGH